MTRYTLSFNCNIDISMAKDQDDTITSPKVEWIESAMASFQDSNTWFNYLVSAHEFTLNEDGGEGEPVPEIKEISITLSEPSVDGEFSGTISWTSAEVDLEKLDENLDWFIGDRMCFYEVCDEDEGWHCFVHPGELTAE
jgi:hypothetical protein